MAENKNLRPLLKYPGGKERELNKYIAHYLIPLIKNFSKKYSYGNQLSMRLLKRQKIMLPIKKDNSPDWLFMESKGKELYKKSSDNLSKYIQKKYNHLAEELEGLEPQTLNSRTWLPFDIENLFTNIQRGKRLTKANQTKGDIPYISSTSLNNGVDGYIGNKNDVRKSGQDITIANSGSVGSSFYHPYNYIASDHVHSLSDKKYNKYHYLFITTLLDRLKDKYHFNYEINDRRLKSDKLLLPINDDSKLDLDFMENYMKHLEYKHLERLLNYIK